MTLSTREFFRQSRTLVLSCIVIPLCFGEVVWGTWSEGAAGAPTNTLHPWWIRSVWSADLASWRQTSFEHAPRRHHRLGKIPQCPAFTLGLLIRRTVEKADHSGSRRGLQDTQQWPSVPDGADQRATSYLYAPLTGTRPLPTFWHVTASCWHAISSMMNCIWNCSQMCLQVKCVCGHACRHAFMHVHPLMCLFW